MCERRLTFFMPGFLAATPGAESDHPLMDLLEQACRGEYGLSVAPQRGAAIMWSHLEGEGGDGGDYDRTRWHDGCNVVSGTKIILQKFKELPRERRVGAFGAAQPPWVKYSVYAAESAKKAEL